MHDTAQLIPTLAASARCSAVAALHSIEGRVYWSETDAAQLVHFTNVLRYCERAEEEFLIKLAGRGWRPGSVVFPRVHVECDYHAPLAPHERWRVDIESVTLGRKSIEYSFHVHNLDRGVISAVCKIVTVVYDPSRGEAIKIPPELRNALLEAGASERA